MWRELIDLFDSSKAFLTNCATYGFNPQTIDLQGWPSNPGAPVQNPAPVTDQNVYDWMMAHLIAITSVGSDQSNLRVTGGVNWA